MCQVSRRSGRGHKQGHVIIQPYNSEHYAITCAAKHDYIAFFHQEMQYRRKAKYPPYCHMVSILIQSPHEELIHSVAIDVKNYLLAHSQQTVILGPARSAIYKMQDIYRERILVKFLHSQDIYEALCVMNDYYNCLLYTSPSPRDRQKSRMPSSA